MKKGFGFILIALFLYIMFKNSFAEYGDMVIKGVAAVFLCFVLLKNMTSRLTNKQSKEDFYKDMEEYEEFLEYKRRYRK